MESESGLIFNTVAAIVLFFLFNKAIPLKTTSNHTNDVTEHAMPF